MCARLLQSSLTLCNPMGPIACQLPLSVGFSRWEYWHGLLFSWSWNTFPSLVLIPGKSHEWRSLVGYSPWGREESDTTEWLHFHISLSCIGEGNGNPLWSSCLESPGDGGAWWAAVYGVAQGRTWLKWLSSSSSSHFLLPGIFPTQGSNPRLLGLQHWQSGSVPLVPPGKLWL